MLRQPPSPLLGVGTSSNTRNSNKFLSKKSSNGLLQTKRTFGFQDVANNTSNRNQYLHSLTSKQTTPISQNLGSRRRSFPVPRKHLISSTRHLSSGRTPAFQSKSKGHFSEERRDSTLNKQSNDGYIPVRHNQVHKNTSKSGSKSRYMSPIHYNMQVAEVQVGDTESHLQQQDTLHRVLEMKKSRQNGPMPNLLANEIRKYTGAFEDISDNVIHAVNSKSYDNSDLYKMPSHSTYQDLTTTTGDKRGVPCRKITSKRSPKKKRSISPFERLFRNNYAQNKVPRRNPSAQLSQFTSYSHNSITQANQLKKTRRPSISRRRSISNVSKQSDAYNKSTRCLSINFPNRVDSKLSYNAGPGSAYFGGMNGHRVEQILVSPPESQMATQNKSYKKKKSKSKRRKSSKHAGYSSKMRSSSKARSDLGLSHHRNFNNLTGTKLFNTSSIRNSRSLSKHKHDSLPRYEAFAQRKNRVQKWMRLMQGHSVVKPKRVISLQPMSYPYLPNYHLPQKSSFVSNRAFTPKVSTKKSTAVKFDKSQGHKTLSAKRKKSIKKVKNSASLSRARRNIKQRDLAQQQIINQPANLNEYYTVDQSMPGTGLIQKIQNPYDQDTPVQSQKNFMSEPDLNQRVNMVNSSFGGEYFPQETHHTMPDILHQRNPYEYQTPQLQMQQQLQQTYGSSQANLTNQYHQLKPRLQTESSQQTLSVENYQINENNQTNGSALNKNPQSGQANFWTSQNRVVTNPIDSDSSSSLDYEYNLTDAARAVMKKQPYLTRKMQNLQNISNPATREVTIIETPDYSGCLPTPHQKLNQHSSSCTLGPHMNQSMMQDDRVRHNSVKKKQKSAKISMISPKSSKKNPHKKQVMSEGKKNRKKRSTSAGLRKSTKSRSKSKSINKSSKKHKSKSASKSKERSHSLRKSRKSISRTQRRNGQITGGVMTREGTILYSPSASGSYVYAPNQILQNNSKMLAIADDESIHYQQYPEHFTKSNARSRSKKRFRVETFPNEQMLQEHLIAQSAKREKRAAMNDQLREQAREQLKELDERQPNRLQQLKEEMQFSLKAIRHTQEKLNGKPEPRQSDRDTIQEAETQASSRTSINEKVNRYAERIDVMLKKQYEQQMSKLQDRRLKVQIIRNRAERERKQEEQLKLEQNHNLTLDNINHSELNNNGQNLDLINANGLMYRSNTNLSHLIEEKEAEIEALRRQNKSFKKARSRNTSGKKSRRNSHSRQNSRLSQKKLDARSDKSLGSNKKMKQQSRRMLSRGSGKKVGISCRSSAKTFAELQSREDTASRQQANSRLGSATRSRQRQREIAKLATRSSEIKSQMRRLMKSQRSPSTKLSQKSAISEKSCKSLRSVSPYKYVKDRNSKVRKFDHSNKKLSKTSQLRSSSKKRHNKMESRTSLSKKRNSRNYQYGFKTEQADFLTSKNSTIVHKCKSGQVSASMNNKKASKSKRREKTRSKSKKKKSKQKSLSKSRRNSSKAFMRTQDGWPSKPQTIENVQDISASANDVVQGVQLFNSGMNMLHTATTNTLGDTYHRQQSQPSDYTKRLRFNIESSSQGGDPTRYPNPYQGRASDQTHYHQNDMNVQEGSSSVNQHGSQHASARSNGIAFNILTAQGMTGSGFVHNQQPGLVYNDHRLNQPSGTFDNITEHHQHNLATMNGSNVPSYRNKAKSKYNSILKNSSAKVGLTSSVQGSQRSWSPRDETGSYHIGGFNSQSKRRNYNRHKKPYNLNDFSDFSDSDSDSMNGGGHTRNQDKIFVNKVHKAVRSTKHNYSGGTATFTNKQLSRVQDSYR